MIFSPQVAHSHNTCRRPSPPAMPFSFGSLRYRGVCPPSKPGLIPLPDLDFWPRMPNPADPPCVMCVM